MGRVGGQRTGRLRCLAIAALLSVALAGQAAAQEKAPPPSDDAADRVDVVVYGRTLPQIGTAISGSQGVVGYRDFEDRPLSRIGELVENVPGLIATQHSGTGKANQYFLRGFNLDHGTDLAGFVDGAPVNMRTHGHGQGYLDLNFLIPELVERIDYRKGPYFADVGDFSAAGTVAFRTVDRLPDSIAEATVGSFGYVRALAAVSTRAVGGDLLVALDGTRSNGPWVLDEDLRKLNGFAKLTTGAISVGLSAYTAEWRATDQVPERAIDSGLIDRLGYIDPDLGGRTTRIGLTLNGDAGPTAWSAYSTYYDFRLTSNFTYFLDDPVAGDEFQQRDRRWVFGGSVRRRFDATLAGRAVAVTLGGDTRYDAIGNVGLYHSQAGVRTGTIRQDSVSEWSGALFGQAEVTVTERLRAMLGVRADLYGYDVRAQQPNGGSGWTGLVQPKIALAWRPLPHVETYFNYGESFHSNDVRGATIRVDPATGEPAERVGVLVRARGAELGARVETGRVSASVVGYLLSLGSELVFVGDAGTTEPNAASRRYGAEVSLFWRPFAGLALDAAAAATQARFSDVAPGETLIPNSVGEVLSAGAALDLTRRLGLTVRFRHFGSAPLIEDGSARSRATTLVNFGAHASVGPARLTLELLNALDAKDADITYFYASRLPGEPAEGVEDDHLHPVEPRQVRAVLRLAF